VCLRVVAYYGRDLAGAHLPFNFQLLQTTWRADEVAVLQLVQAGRISLDDKLSVYYPNFPRGDEVTIRELLTHTSGIHNFTEFGVTRWRCCS
jgi:Beta-lactamase